MTPRPVPERAALRSMKSLLGYTIRAIDGDIGSVHDFYFDDRVWTVRYLVVNTGNWLAGRKVLIAPVSVGRPQWRELVFPVNLTKEQVKNSPDVNAEKPISREMEERIYQYYGWPQYWGDPMFAPGALPVSPRTLGATRDAEAELAARTPEGRLQSMKEVIGYRIQALDGEIGHVDDFIVDEETLRIRYMVVDTKNWAPGRKTLVSPDWIDQVNWSEARVRVGVSREAVRISPEYDPSAHINREYEERLYDYYGRPAYWCQ